MKKWIIIGAIVIILLLPSILAIRYFMAAPIGKVEMQEKVQSGDFRIFSYEYFFNATVNIKTAEQNYISQNEKLKLLQKDSDEYNRTLSNIAALEGFIIQLKTQYNVDVQKEGTRGQFKASSLPEYYEPILPKIN